MSEHSKTILRERILSGKTSVLEGGYFSVVRMRLVAMGGWQSNSIEAKVLDNHYLIENVDVVRDFTRKPLAIVDIHKPKEAIGRMYNEARKIAEEWAKYDGNEVLDITSRVATKIPKDAHYYVDDLVRA